MKNKISLFVLFVLFCIICVIRFKTLSTNELSWDVFGYYLYLPATLIQHDPMLHSVSWIHEIMAKLPISGTLYQLSQGPSGNNVYFFLMGMSIIYSPFFFIGYVTAMITGSPTDGFSLPFQYSIALGCLIYALIGLYFLRKILLSFFNDNITAFILVVIVLGTNYLHFATIKNLETASVLFTFLALLTWATIQWHKTLKLKYLISISFCAALITLIKPSEIICIIIPLLWGVYNKQTLKEKIALIVQHKNQFYISILVGLLLILPQLIYWKIATGHFIYDSYKNPGVGLDFLSPHIINILFSFRKGWLIYTPIMIFSIIGFIFLYKKRREIFPAIFLYFLVTFYIISSWTEWWYGASFSIRPLIASYIVLAIPLGYTLQRILELNPIKKGIFLFVIVLLIVLNLFQMWQQNNYILDPYRTTKAYYFATFGKTKISPETRYLLSIERSFNAETEHFHNETYYNQRNIGYYDFATKDTNFYKNYHYDTLSKSMVFQLDSVINFSPSIKIPYRGITSKDHAWIRASVDVFIPEGYNEETPCLVLTFSRKNGLYAYRTATIAPENLKYNQWIRVSMDYLTPEVRSINDVFHSYIWHRGKRPIYIDNFKVDTFEPK